MAFCRLDYLEGSPDPDHPLKGRVVAVVLGAITTFAIAVGRAEVRLCDPAPALIPRYEALGFVLARQKG